MGGTKTLHNGELGVLRRTPSVIRKNGGETRNA
jgi:hypothetical protein